MREGAEFLKDLGVSAAVAQRVVRRFGGDAEREVRNDPFVALKDSGSFG
jgi:Helix-hairpin-helix containing domain